MFKGAEILDNLKNIREKQEDERVGGGFEKDFDKLFKKYESKTSDGYIELLYLKK